MSQSCFMTGTDTEIGKTYCSVALMNDLAQRGQRVVGMKPVAAGCIQTAEGLRNEDALALQAASTIAVPYATVNPYAFEPPIAPHIAAAQINVEISLSPIVQAYQSLQQQADWVVVEGVGGWRVPLSEELTLLDLVNALKIPVILVVGMRLGCINHALLTAEILESDGCFFQGWIANWLQPPTAIDRSVLSALQRQLAVPLLAELAYQNQVLRGSPWYENFLQGHDTHTGYQAT